MNRKAALFLLLAALTAVPVAALALTPDAALHGVRAGRLAAVGAVLPALYALLAAAVAWAGARARPLAATPQTLAVRLPLADDGVPDGAASGVAVCATWLVGNALAFFASIGPASWSDAWECASTGPGETSCDLVTGGWSMTFFVVACITGFFAVPGVIMWGRSVVRGLRALGGPGAPIVEVSSGQLFAAEPFDVRVVQRVRGGGTAVEVFLRCAEKTTWQRGEDTTTDAATVFTQRVAGAVASAPGLVECGGRYTLPAHVMHTFRTKQREVKWDLVVKTTAGRTETTHAYEVPVAPSTPAAWRRA